MAVVTLKSTPVTNRDASPQVANNAGKGAGYRSRKVDGQLVADAADNSSGSTYRLCRVPSNCIVKSVTWDHTAFGGSCAGDVGVYYPAAGPDLGIGQTASAVIDADLFASALTLVSLLTAPLDVTSESGVYTLDERTLPLWQAAGLSADPGGKFDVVVTLTAAAAAAGRVMVTVEYVEM